MTYFHIDKIKDPNYNFVKKTILIIFILLTMITFLFYINLINKNKNALWYISPIVSNLPLIESIKNVNNGYLIVGRSSHSYNTIKILELDKHGKEIWTKTISGKNTVTAELKDSYIIGDNIIDKKTHRITNKIDNKNLQSIVSTDDGFIGVVNDFLTFEDTHKIFKFDNNGKEIWNKEILYEDKHNVIKEKDLRKFLSNEIIIKKDKSKAIRFMKVIKTVDNNYLAIAENPFFIIKFDKDGNLIWQHDYSGKFFGKFIDLIQLENGSFLSNVYMYKNKKKFGKRTIHIFKFSSNGEIIWNKELINLKKKGSLFSWFIKPLGKDEYLITISDRFKNHKINNQFILFDSDGNIKKKNKFYLFGRESFLRVAEPMDKGELLLGGNALYDYKDDKFVIDGITYEPIRTKNIGLLYKLPNNNLKFEYTQNIIVNAKDNIFDFFKNISDKTKKEEIKSADNLLERKTNKENENLNKEDIKKEKSEEKKDTFKVTHEIETQLEKFFKKPHFKSFAVAIDGPNEYTYALTYNENSLNTAHNDAKKLCEKKKKELNIKSSCRVISDGKTMNLIYDKLIMKNTPTKELSVFLDKIRNVEEFNICNNKLINSTLEEHNSLMKLFKKEKLYIDKMSKNINSINANNYLNDTSKVDRIRKNLKIRKSQLEDIKHNVFSIKKTWGLFKIDCKVEQKDFVKEYYNKSNELYNDIKKEQKTISYLENEIKTKLNHQVKN
ncbi:hypothetical protein [Halarcobacter sp.]|uniref:hypothetical protein n=1 Tax=Halarcobacter sp. TaxID=2321133 RepID=UPI0029F59034|nr:hypothetical protein [Halarcobacter sp.]